MEFIADLHTHSYLSRATSRQMNLEGLHTWAQMKGITVVGTGDFTHPRWFDELQTRLEPAEPGLYRLKDSANAPDPEVPGACRAPVRFMLSAEISTIYKKAGKTRKVHSLILAPSLNAAGKLNAALQEVGNISSDGRPILGLDCKDLLHMTLDASPDNTFIPAHIWTPHFSVLGAASGFDSIDECFEELSKHIFALETGLSSDPPMNWMLSQLDRFILVSNSDAHSPSRLGREANIFCCELSYYSMMKALKEKDRHGFVGTIEFFPEEGKYHYDGHRACSVRLSPEETAGLSGRCPVCGKKVTVGVMNRVKELSDRRRGQRPGKAFDYISLVPLQEVLAAIYAVGPGSKKVVREYHRLLGQLGNELHILRSCPVPLIKDNGHNLLAEALEKMRAGRVCIAPGYDGEYGNVSLLEPWERNRNQLSLFS